MGVSFQFVFLKLNSTTFARRFTLECNAKKSDFRHTTITDTFNILRDELLRIKISKKLNFHYSFLIFTSVYCTQWVSAETHLQGGGKKSPPKDANIFHVSSARGTLPLVSSTTSCQKYILCAALNYSETYYPGLLSELLYLSAAYQMSILLSLATNISEGAGVSPPHFLIVLHYFLRATSVACISVRPLNKLIGFIYIFVSPPSNCEFLERWCLIGLYIASAKHMVKTKKW